MGIGAAPRLSSRLNLGWMWKPALRGGFHIHLKLRLPGGGGRLNLRWMWKPPLSSIGDDGARRGAALVVAGRHGVADGGTGVIGAAEGSVGQVGALRVAPD